MLWPIGSDAATRLRCGTPGPPPSVAILLLTALLQVVPAAMVAAREWA